MLLCLLAACGPNGAVQDDLNVFTVGAAGGLLEVEGLEVEIPPGALDRPIDIRLVDLGIDPPAPYEGLSTVWSLEPVDLVFDQPVTVRLPYSDHPHPKLVFVSEGDAFAARSDSTFASDVAIATLDHFGELFVALSPIETHVQTYDIPPADLLFVVDNSSSMQSHQQALADEAPAVFDALDEADLDYHIGVVSTDMNDPQNGQGKLRQVGEVRYIEPSTPNARGVFVDMVNIGTTGHWEEKGRSAAWTLFELKRDIPRNEVFYRDEASLDIVFLSDEDDASGGNPVSRQEFVSWMRHLKERPELTRAHALVQQPNLLCGSGAAGTEYVGYATASGGTVVDLCSSDWTSPLTGMAHARLAGGIIELPEAPGVVVSVRLLGETDRQLGLDQYTVDGAFVRFDRGLVPAPGETVEVRYRP